MSRPSQFRSTRARPAGLVLGAVFALTLFPTPAGATEPTRSEYVNQLEKICKPDSEATQRAVSGTKADVRSEHLPRAAAKVLKAQRIFTGTVNAIVNVARPAADQATLDRWFEALKRESAALGRTAAALRIEDVALFQRVWAKFIHEGNKANNVVVSFGFNYCSFKPSRFI